MSGEGNFLPTIYTYERIMFVKIIKEYSPKYIIGIDEVGTGCVAGDVYVCAFMAPTKWSLDGVKDSKTLSEKKREELNIQLYSIARKSKNYGFSLTHVHPNNKEEYKDYGTNLHGALKSLYWRSASRLLEYSTDPANTLIVLDGIIKIPTIPYPLCKSISLPKADALIPHVSAASIIAKVNRDHYMKNLSVKYPNYKWDENKGYPTPEHLSLVKKYGVSPEHRTSYKPIQILLNKSNK